MRSFSSDRRLVCPDFSDKKQASGLFYLRTARMLKTFGTRLFGTASGTRVLLRVAADFGVAQLSLLAAAILRIALSSGLHPEDPVGHLAGKVNSLYLVHAGWFSVSA